MAITNRNLGPARLTPAESEREITRLRNDCFNLPQVQRTPHWIAREYSRDKYGGVLANKPATAQRATELLHENRGFSLSEPRIVAINQQLYRMSLADALERHHAILDQALEQARHQLRPDWICELGCGFGSNVSRHGPQCHGGDIADQGVALGRSLGLDIRHFDFLDAESYSLIRRNTLIFTCAAIEQLRSAQPVLNGLRSVRDRLAGVIHFEPTVRDTRHGPLGRLQNEYLKRCDYNRDLEQVLKAPDIRVHWHRHDLIAVNPLNPSSLYFWTFTE